MADRQVHKVKALVDSGCTHTAITKDLVKERRIPTELITVPFNVFNADGTKSGEAMISEYIPMELSTNGHMEQVEAVVADIKGTDIYLGHNWLVKHNQKINWKEGIIQFSNCPHNCKIAHQDITFERYN
jgi:predicted aspartyl protease